MFDFNQPLEHSDQYYELVNPRAYSPGYFIATVNRNGRYYDDWVFSTTTGVERGYESKDNPRRARPKSESRPQDQFHIQVGQADWSKDQWVTAQFAEPYKSGTEAAEVVKLHTEKARETNSPFKFRIKKEVIMSPVREHMKWFEFRLASGEYTNVPWAGESWAKPEHCAHLGIADDSKIAFYDGENAAQKDEFTVMAPGRYLQKFYADVLTPTQIRDYAVAVDCECELKFAMTEDAIYDIYTAPNGPSSCMRYPDHTTCHDGITWKSGKNPVRIYAAGDLALAYLERKGKIIARALVWPAKKAAFRRYGDLERMDSALEAAGYELDCKDSNAGSTGEGLFNGARLQLIRSSSTHIVMPYLDYCYGHKIEDGVLTMQLGGSYSTSTSGVVSCDYSLADIPITDVGADVDDDDDDDYDACAEGDCECCSQCDNCSTTTDSDAMYSLNDGDRSLCNRCYSNEAISCDYCSDSYTSDRLTTIYDARYEDADDRETHSDACTSCVSSVDSIVRDVNGILVDTDTATHCDECGEYFSGNLDTDECPTPSCVVARETSNEELETVA